MGSSGMEPWVGIYSLYVLLCGNTSFAEGSIRHLSRMRQPVASAPTVRVKRFTDATRRHAYGRESFM